MNTNMTGLRWFFKNPCVIVLWMTVASALEISLTIVVWTCDTLENNLCIYQEIYLKGSCSLVSYLCFSCKYFQKITFV